MDKATEIRKQTVAETDAVHRQQEQLARGERAIAYFFTSTTQFYDCSLVNLMAGSKSNPVEKLSLIKSIRLLSARKFHLILEIKYARSTRK